MQLLANGVSSDCLSSLLPMRSHKDAGLLPLDFKVEEHASSRKENSASADEVHISARMGGLSAKDTYVHLRHGKMSLTADGPHCL